MLTGPATLGPAEASQETLETVWFEWEELETNFESDERQKYLCQL